MADTHAATIRGLLRNLHGLTTAESAALEAAAEALESYAENKEGRLAFERAHPGVSLTRANGPA